MYILRHGRAIYLEHVIGCFTDVDEFFTTLGSDRGNADHPITHSNEDEWETFRGTRISLGLLHMWSENTISHTSEDHFYRSRSQIGLATPQKPPSRERTKLEVLEY